MVTQKEIAERLGISRTTVARAINGSSLIKEETKKKIMELVKEMKYEKNIIGSSLGKKSKKKVYCLVVKSKNEFYTTEIIKGLLNAEKEYKSYGIRFEILLTDINKPEDQVEKLKKILEKKVDGIVIIPLLKEKINNILEPYFEKIKIVSLGIELNKKIYHIGPDYLKQGKIAGEIMSSLLRENEKLLILDNGDDKISSKKYLEGFLDKFKDKKFLLEGPIKSFSIEEGVNILKEKLKKEKIEGIYINRYAQDIYKKIPQRLLKNKKIVTNGMSKEIKKMIDEKIIVATVVEEVSLEGYLAGKRIFELLYQVNSDKEKWEVSKSHIIFKENLND